MMIVSSEPICAQITPPGTGAISVVRISGSGSIGIVAQFFQPRAKLLNAATHTALFGSFHSQDGQMLDQVLCTVFRSPHSYTGDDTVEISSHGNPRLVSRILENLLSEARLAKPGEFTLRALLNGKLDLTQAEAVNDLISAQGSKAESAALMQIQGLLSLQLRELLDEITQARMRCELAIDFADQDLPQIDTVDLRHRLEACLSKAREFQSDGNRGRYIRDGLRVCLAGAPNSGKSSLFNAFLKSNRAIVTPHPGTTRDYLEESVSLEGYQLVLYDTAGLRDTSEDVERKGIDRSMELMRGADLILYLLPVNMASQANEEENVPQELRYKTLWLASKADLAETADPNETAPDGFSPERRIPVSAVAQNGLQTLQKAILDYFSLPRERLERPLITNARQLAALNRSVASLEKALEALTNEIGFEFVAFDLIAASKALEEILGIVTADDLLEKIFSSFCIGK